MRIIFKNVSGLTAGTPLLFCAYTPAANAADVHANVRVGAYNRSVKFEEPLAGEETNDELIYSAQLKADITNFNRSDDSVIVDLRDKFDSYGKLESQNLRLVSYNQFQVRELAYERPWESNRLFFKAGRFSLREANIISNDGAEIGFRSSRESRFGLFGGQAPKNIVTPLYVNVDETRTINNTQGGAYYVYESKQGIDRSLYATNAITSSPTYNLTETTPKTSFYHLGLWNLSGFHRVSTLVEQDFAPTSALRRAYLTYTYLGPSVRTNLGVTQTNTEDYLVQKQLLDPLEPSAVQSANLDLRHRLWPRLSLDYGVSYSKRVADGNSATDVSIGVISPKFLVASGSARAQFGARNNYVSDDQYVRVGYDYWNQYFSLGISQFASVEDYKDGTINHRRITSFDGGFHVTDRFRGTLVYQLEQDDKLTANALFLMIGYRFGTGSVSPTRTKPALFEEI